MEDALVELDKTKEMNQTVQSQLDHQSIELARLHDLEKSFDREKQFAMTQIDELRKENVHVTVTT